MSPSEMLDGNKSHTLARSAETIVLIYGKLFP